MGTGSVAAGAGNSMDFQPWLVFVIIAVVLVANFTRAVARRSRRRNDANQPAQAYLMQGHNSQGRNASHTAQPGRQPVAAPYAGTLLNGLPMKSYDSPGAHQVRGFASERMLAEAELKRQLDALDAARRSGKVTAEQYALHREAIFKNF
ncbi:hypothetical protein [Specibacter sp. RAF43]|uniref:hypothetical protein n=1 Tax=Specibacter sp. RAF43 TaxID=3233057 RepID=UPI003F9EA4A3